jgi:predicted HAD superfamily Cof-like phosphohydrolase
MNQLIDLVKVFIEKTEQPSSNTPIIPDNKLAQFRYNLMKEELDEFLTAVQNKNTTEILDSLVDQLYVLLGTAITCGVSDALILGFLEVHRSNMTKVQEDGTILRDNNGKVSKPPGYRPPDLERILLEIY